MIENEDSLPRSTAASQEGAEGSGPATESTLGSAPINPVEDLETKLAAQSAEAQKFQDLYLRERADLENFKRRMQREKLEAIRFAAEPLVRDLLGVADNLERAAAHAENKEESVAEGIKLVLKSLFDVFERHGIKRIDSAGSVFDPLHHEAIAQVESPDHEPNQVVAQHQSGYMLHDRLLRPALVSVCGRKSNPSVETGENRD